MSVLRKRGWLGMLSKACVAGDHSGSLTSINMVVIFFLLLLVRVYREVASALIQETSNVIDSFFSYIYFDPFSDFLFERDSRTVLVGKCS